MFFFLWLVFFFVNIGFRAKARGLRPALWVFATILSVFACIFIAMIFMVVIWTRQYGVSMEELQKMVEANEIKPSIYNELFLYISAFGGYLLTRYLVDRRAKQAGRSEDDSAA